VPTSAHITPTRPSSNDSTHKPPPAGRACPREQQEQRPIPTTSRATPSPSPQAESQQARSTNRSVAYAMKCATVRGRGSSRSRVGTLDTAAPPPFPPLRGTTWFCTVLSRTADARHHRYRHHALLALHNNGATKRLNVHTACHTNRCLTCCNTRRPRSQLVGVYRRFELDLFDVKQTNPLGSSRRQPSSARLRRCFRKGRRRSPRFSSLHNAYSFIVT